MAHRKVSHICAVVGFLAFVAFPDESWGGGLVGAAAVPGLVFDEGVGVEVTTSSGSSEEAIILPYPRKGVRRSIVGFMILSLALLHFYFKTYPKIFPKYKKALLYGQNIAAQLAGEEPVSEAEYNVQRYIDYASKNPERATAEAAGAFVGLLLLLNGIGNALQPRKKRIFFRKKN